MPKNDFFTLSEEIEFVGKGYKEKNGTETSSNSLYYLEVPVLMNYNHKMKNGHLLYGGLGAYAASGIFGHYIRALSMAKQVLEALNLVQMLIITGWIMVLF